MTSGGTHTHRNTLTQPHTHTYISVGDNVGFGVFINNNVAHLVAVVVVVVVAVVFI